MLRLILGWALGLSVGLAGEIGFYWGHAQGQAEIFNSCSSYGRYEFPDVNMYINCVGPVTPWVPDPYRPYSKEEKDKWAKQRK